MSCVSCYVHADDYHQHQRTSHQSGNKDWNNPAQRHNNLSFKSTKKIDRLPFKVHIFDFTTLILSQSLTNPVWIGATTLCAFFLESLKINAGWHMWEQQHYCSWRPKRVERGGFVGGGGSEAMRITFGSYCDVRSFAWHRHWKLRIVNIVKWRHKNWLVILRHISWRATLTTSKAADDSNKKAHDLLPNSMT